MPSKQQMPVHSLDHSTRSTTGKRFAVPHNGESGNPVLRGLKSKSKRFPIDLLTGILSSSPSSLECPHPILQSIEHPGVARCLRFIGRNPCLKLRDLVNISGLSRRGLHKAFRTHLGCAPGAVVIMVRLWSACDLLANSRLSVAKIAAGCGYRNSNSLYVAFQRYLGKTPLNIRRQSPLYDRGDVEKETRLRNTPLPPRCSRDVNSSCVASAQLNRE